MHRVDGADNVPVLPTFEQPGPPGFFSRGVSTSGKLATVVTQDWLNTVQEEIVAVIDWAGIPLDKTSLTQLRDALIRMFRPVIATDVGTVNAVMLSAPKGPALELGVRLTFRAATSNTGATTLTYNGQGPWILRNLAFQLQGGEIYANHIYTVLYDDSGQWILVEGEGGSFGVSPATKSNHAINLGQFPTLFDARFYPQFAAQFAASFTAAFNGAFPAAFDSRWDAKFNPAWDARFTTQFPSNFDARFTAEFYDAFVGQVNNYLLPTHFSGNSDGASYWWKAIPNSHGVQMLIQGGRLLLSTGQQTIINFPAAYPRGCAAITCSDMGGSWGNPPTAVVCGAQPVSNAYFYATAAFVPGGGAQNSYPSISRPIWYSWMSMGW